MRREIVAKQQPCGRPCVVEEFRRFARVELLEMGFAVGTGVQAVEFYAASVLILPSVMARDAEERSTCNIRGPLMPVCLVRRKAPQGDSLRSRTGRNRGAESSGDSKEPGSPRKKRGGVATLSAEHRMDDAPGGVEDRQADRCVYDHFEPERKIFHGVLHRIREMPAP
jgi:hypothetical protein